MESKGGSGVPAPLPIPPPPPNSSLLWSLSLGPRFSSPTFTAVPQGPRQPPTSICRKTSRPSVISPNTTCLPSSQSVLSHVRKNWEPLVFGPELAMESRPGGEKRPSAPPTLLVVLGMEGGVQMLPLHLQTGGRMGRGPGADYVPGGEEWLQWTSGAGSQTRGGQREPMTGSLDNFFKKFW